MKVLILGSTGMLGHVLSDYLTKLNKYDIYNLSRSNLIKINYFSVMLQIKKTL